MEPIIIGLTGTNASGKTTILKYLLIKHGFRAYSLSDIVRDELDRESKEKTRKAQVDKGNEMRRMHGHAILAEMVLEKIRVSMLNGCRKFVADSVRNPAELSAFRKSSPLFELWAIDAPLEKRFLRLKDRGRIDPFDSAEEFRKQEMEEFSKDDDRQQVGECIRLSDVKIMNSAGLPELYKIVDSNVERIYKKQKD